MFNECLLNKDYTKKNKKEGRVGGMERDKQRERKGEKEGRMEGEEKGEWKDGNGRKKTRSI